MGRLPLQNSGGDAASDGLKVWAISGAWLACLPAYCGAQMALWVPKGYKGVWHGRDDRMTPGTLANPWLSRPRRARRLARLGGGIASQLPPPALVAVWVLRPQFAFT